MSIQALPIDYTQLTLPSIVFVRKCQGHRMCFDEQWEPPLLFTSQYHNSNIKGHAFLCRMKPRCLLSTVNRLPTINEMQESDTEDGDLDCSSHTMEEYVDSIKELSQPAPYPLHGPLRGHRRWMDRTCRRVRRVAASGFLSTYAPWIPVDLSDISITLTNQSNCESFLRFNQSLLDRVAEQSQFAGVA